MGSHEMPNNQDSQKNKLKNLSDSTLSSEIVDNLIQIRELELKENRTGGDNADLIILKEKVQVRKEEQARRMSGN